MLGIRGSPKRAAIVNFSAAISALVGIREAVINSTACSGVTPIDPLEVASIGASSAEQSLGAGVPVAVVAAPVVGFKRHPQPSTQSVYRSASLRDTLRSRQERFIVDQLVSQVFRPLSVTIGMAVTLQTVDYKELMLPGFGGPYKYSVPIHQIARRLVGFMDI